MVSKAAHTLESGLLLPLILTEYAALPWGLEPQWTHWDKLLGAPDKRAEER